MKTPLGPGAQARLQHWPQALQIMPAAPSAQRLGPTDCSPQ